MIAALVNSASRISLPLMGIGNSAMEDYLGTVDYVSLPLMGIGNSEDAVCPGSGSAAHYPSWGSGTRTW